MRFVQQHGRKDRNLSINVTSMLRCLLRAESGVRADGEFGELGFGLRFMAAEIGANDGKKKAERDAEDAGIFQGENGSLRTEEAHGADEDEAE